MGNGNLRAHRAGQPKVRSFTAIDAHMRSSAGPMGKLGKGRTRKDTRSRSSVRADLRLGGGA